MSKKTKYALKALIRLAANYNKGLMQTADIANKENIPKKFLEQIFSSLKSAKMVNSKSGIGGGHYLAKHPKLITVADVYRLFDGPIALLPCVSLNFYEKCDDCKSEEKCLLRAEFVKIREKTRKVMSKTTLESFLK